MYLIVGLGNPGKKYANTRHNLGFLAINELSKKFDVSLQKHQDLFEDCRVEISGEKVILAQPLTFMNKSGDITGKLEHDDHGNDHGYDHDLNVLRHTHSCDDTVKREYHVY